ncbi:MULTISPECIES: hypothetical protein [Micromonosporaceae]|uniref:hypothetical protein n=1 Tax=Micromonosporaceae TaxID=28056 RepID=UPI000F4664C2|nr:MULTISPECIES: hypothetical protein [Micromonosporaceae]MDG4771596.1 hypothetical protein [Solwaraspora sp. WMMD792]ROO60963.1 hypothetical protein EDC02_2884 [Micromonospora sp. Llam0]WBC00060.1 hypothetical protein O7553_14795 [Solwaraspora sp. WMMA2059]WBC21395.1 hypothetical protein O7543_02575 [Solwaraspora sp. WMMA2080]WFE20747.1 hypothetical protein O7621_23150 [Solwaraspora sp. WMMD937]
MSPAAGAATLATRRSSRFVAWVRAWRAGLVPYDEIADEIAGDEEHLVADAPGAWTDLPLRDALSCFAKLPPDEIRLALPAPGDPRGLPGPGEFTGAALLAGEAVVARGLGVIPEVRSHTSGSGVTFETVLWRIYPLPQELPAAGHAGPSAAEAEAELSTALAETTTALTRLDVAHWRPELAGALAALRRPDGGMDLPPGFDPRARRLFARASVLDQVLALAEHVAPGGAVNGYEAQQRDAALRPLTTACRRALVAACNAPLRP